MFTREQIVAKVKQILEEHDIEYLDFSEVDCVVFDIIYRSNELVILKIFKDIECLKKEVAKNFKKIAKSILAKPLIIAEMEKKEKIMESSIGFRYNIPFVNLKTFENIIKGKNPEIYYHRGGKYIKVEIINEEKVKKILKDEGFSRKRVYEILKSNNSGVRVEYYEKIKNYVRVVEINPFSINIHVEPELCIGKKSVYLIEKAPYDASIISNNELELLIKFEEYLFNEMQKLSEFLAVESLLIKNKRKNNIYQILKNYINIDQ